ncbi:MAG: nitroreductase family deazaflavin-dependent oxidoreductase [bacterium]|nr:nitroreductase family deazaflavin-dependent oxidoreductase [bacterium]
MTDWNDWNQAVIDEFRTNDGRVGGMFEGSPLLLLHHVGARTGLRRVAPLMYQDVPDGYAIFASKGGADTNPDWYHNLVANPETEAEVGSETVPVLARIANDEERTRIWTRQKSDYPQFADYESKTQRVIPVVVLERT